MCRVYPDSPDSLPWFRGLGRLVFRQCSAFKQTVLAYRSEPREARKRRARPNHCSHSMHRPTYHNQTLFGCPRANIPSMLHTRLAPTGSGGLQGHVATSSHHVWSLWAQEVIERVRYNQRATCSGCVTQLLPRDPTALVNLTQVLACTHTHTHTHTQYLPLAWGVQAAHTRTPLPLHIHMPYDHAYAHAHSGQLAKQWSWSRRHSQECIESP